MNEFFTSAKDAVVNTVKANPNAAVGVVIVSAAIAGAAAGVYAWKKTVTRFEKKKAAFDSVGK